jgi:O-antigen biosynthesis protein
MVSKLSERNVNSFFRPSALFWPQYLEYQSAWFEHGPFAFWLMDILRPRCFVELGTHTGYSYFCFCQAVQRLHLGTSCYAIDTWTGDEHSGIYGEEVFHAVANHNQRYISFSTLICSTFDDAVGYFPEKKIELLHIDGRHFYDDVRHDFESWRSRLSDDAIILFHDTNVRERQFGVWKLFEELKKKHPTFEFKHGHGLGVVALNKVPLALKSLFAADQKNADDLRMTFSALGNAVTKMWQARVEQMQLKDQNAQLQEQRIEWQENIARFETEKSRLVSDKLSLTDTVTRLTEEQHRSQALKSILEKQLKNLSNQIERVPESEQKQHTTDITSLLNLNEKHQLSFSIIRRFKYFFVSHFLPQIAKLDDVKQSIFFDADWYLTTYPDVGAINMNPAKHYLEFGAFEGRDPGPLFSTEQYFSKYPHIAGSKINPLVHISNLRKKQRGGTRKT